MYITLISALKNIFNDNLPESKILDKTNIQLMYGGKINLFEFVITMHNCIIAFSIGDYVNTNNIINQSLIISQINKKTVIPIHMTSTKHVHFLQKNNLKIINACTIDQFINKLLIFLYSKHIFLYEPDGSTIMLNST